MSEITSVNFEEIVQRVSAILELQEKSTPQNKQIAHALGLSFSNFSNIKSRNRIPYEALAKFAKKHNSSLEFLLYGASSCSSNDYIYKIESLKKKCTYLAEYLQENEMPYLIYDYKAQKIIEDIDRINDIYANLTYIKQLDCYIRRDDKNMSLYQLEVRNGVLYEGNDLITAVCSLAGLYIEATMKIDCRKYFIEIIGFDEETGRGNEHLKRIILNNEYCEDIDLF